MGFKNGIKINQLLDVFLEGTDVHKISNRIGIIQTEEVTSEQTKCIIFNGNEKILQSYKDGQKLIVRPHIKSRIEKIINTIPTNFQ